MATSVIFLNRLVITRKSIIGRAFVTSLFIALVDTTGTHAAPNAANGVSNSSQTLTVNDWRGRFRKAIPVKLQVALRKYGPYDSKVQGAIYENFTSVMYGAICARAGMPRDMGMGWAQVSAPNTDDLQALSPDIMEKEFLANRQILESLLSMARQDSKMIRIARDFTWLAGNPNWPRKEIGVSEQRWSQYKRLFDRASLTEGIARPGDFPDAVFFISQSAGLCTGGWSAGYVNSQSPLSPITDRPVDTLKAALKAGIDSHQSTSGYAFKKLADNWYEFFEFD